VLIVLGLGAFFMANVDLPSWAPAVSAASVILFAVPAIWAAKMWLGWRDALILFAVLALLALLIEIAAISTGIPYGHFGYSDHLGLKLFGVVPWTVSFAWPPLILGAYGIAANLVHSRMFRVLLTALLLVAFDLVLDPGAVSLGFWKYVDAGSFYGVPLSNFAGWLLSGLVGAIITETMVSYFRPLLPVPVQLSSSAFLIIFFWAALAAFAGMLAPAVIGAGVLLGLIIVWRKHHFAFDEMIVLVDHENNATGTAPKLAAHNSATELHRAFSVFIFNPRGELLLQRRSLTKKTWPGVWSNSCCGHVMLHESTERAATRRLKHELGLADIELTIALPDFRYRAEKDGVVENEICPVLIGLTDREPQINRSEVADIRWVDWNTFLRSVDDAETQISPWASEEVRLLADSDVFKRWFAHRIPVSGTAFAPVC
jgi:isopentenyl-diphosphate delta-isomerase type 1